MKNEKDVSKTTSSSILKRVRRPHPRIRKPKTSAWSANVSDRWVRVRVRVRVRDRVTVRVRDRVTVRVRDRVTVRVRVRVRVNTSLHYD